MAYATAYAYVEGMNLYYGAVKNNPPCKWRDVPWLRGNLVPQLTVVHTRYDTACIKATFPDDPGPGRQQIYLEAWQSRKRITSREGIYADWPPWQRLDESQGRDSPIGSGPPGGDRGQSGRPHSATRQGAATTCPTFVLAQVRRTEENKGRT